MAGKLEQLKAAADKLHKICPGPWRFTWLGESYYNAHVEDSGAVRGDYLPIMLEFGENGAPTEEATAVVDCLEALGAWMASRAGKET